MQNPPPIMLFLAAVNARMERTHILRTGGSGFFQCVRKHELAKVR